jgi:hypothetical protein
MRKHWKTMVAITAICSLIAAFGIIGFSQQDTSRKEGMEGNWDRTISSCEYISSKWYTVACAGMTPKQQGMVSIQDTGRRMGTIAVEAREIMENMDLMMKNEYFTKHEEMKKLLAELQTNLTAMSESVQKATDNLDAISKKMEALDKK